MKFGTGPIKDLQAGRLSPDDIDAAMSLSREAGWNQTQADWRILLDVGQGYCYRSDDGSVVATAVTLPHGERIAWISMVLVTKSFQKQGLATRLLQTCVQELTRRSICPLLDATVYGKPVYEKMDFRSLYGMQRRVCTQIPKPIPETVPLPEGHRLAPVLLSDLPEIIAFDRLLFGADRSAILSHLHARQPDYAILCRDRSRQICGFMMAREGLQALHLGPVLARSPDIAGALLRSLLEKESGPLYIDTLDGQDRFLVWIEACGFVPQRSFTRMVLGDPALFDPPDHIFAMAGPELG